MLHGVDISGHQAGWTPGPDDQFVFVKSTEGTTFVNGSAPAQLNAARDKGLQIGHYHFLWPGDAAKQAAYFIAKTDIQHGDLIVCDWENTKDGHPTVPDAANFIAEVKRIQPDHKVGLYCNASDWMGTAVKAGDFLWVAHYGVDKPAVGTTKWDFWQYADHATITGANIDQNKARFNTLEELKTWAAGKPAPPIFHSEKWKSDYVRLNGGWVTPVDRQIVLACAKASGWGTVRLSQGGLSTAVTASAMTHAGLAVGDIAPDGRTKAQVWELCGNLIRSGIIAFPRGYGGDSFSKHIHFVSVESLAHAHPQAQAQVAEWKKGGDGLRGDRPYNGPKVPLGTWRGSPYNPANSQPVESSNL